MIEVCEIVDPIAEDDNGIPRPIPAQLRHDTRHEHRALADTARSVKDGQGGGQEIGNDDPLIALAPEEELDLEDIEVVGIA